MTLRAPQQQASRSWASHQRGNTKVAGRLPLRVIVHHKTLTRHGCTAKGASGSQALQPVRADGVDSKFPKHHPPPPPHPHHSGIKHRWARARLPPAPPYRLLRPQPSHWLQPLDSGRYGLAASVAAAAPPRIPAVAVAYSGQECQRRHQHLQACCGIVGRAHARLCWCRNR
jgi:hypothetical protein